MANTCKRKADDSSLPGVRESLVSSYQRCCASSLPSQTVPAVNSIGKNTRIRRVFRELVDLVDENDGTWYTLKKISNIDLMRKRFVVYGLMNSWINEANVA